jgi:hypothetical protein
MVSLLLAAAAAVSGRSPSVVEKEDGAPMAI